MILNCIFSQLYCDFTTFTVFLSNKYEHKRLFSKTLKNRTDPNILNNRVNVHRHLATIYTVDV